MTEDKRRHRGAVPLERGAAGSHAHVLQELIDARRAARKG